MLPEGWEICTVDQLFDVQLGKMLNQTAKELHPQHQYLGNTNVKWGRFELLNLNTMFFNEKEKNKFTLVNGDIVMCEGGEVGRCAIWRDNRKDTYYQKALHRLRSKGKIHPEFFQNFMQHIAETKLLDDFTTRTSIAHLTREKLLQLPVRLPPLPEQTKIAQILSTWDKAITTTERLLANSQQQKQALMQQLLTGQKRFAGFTEDWKHYALGQLFSERNETNRPDLSLLSITTEQGVIDRADSGKKDTSSEDKSKYRRICPGDIGYNTMRMWQGVSGLSDKEGIVSPAYTILQPTKLVDSKFASYLFKTPTLIHVFMRHSQGLVSDTWNLKYEHFAKIKVFVPCAAEQQKIAQVLSTTDAEIANLQTQLAKLKLEKKALMQQLLTGQRRVKLDDEVEAPTRRVG
ncbi:MAG TPA: restriction endonuclease subunit S [Pseudomonas sp.]|nr:restriction endonuclease subunit S [Pseudomonas sp.]